VSSSKKEVIIGAVIVIISSLWVINVGMSIVGAGMPPLLSLSASQNSFISWLITIFAVFGAGCGLWIISQSDKPTIKQKVDRSLYCQGKNSYLFPLWIDPINNGIATYDWFGANYMGFCGSLSECSDGLGSLDFRA